MDFLGGMGELSETSEVKGTEGQEISQESCDKFDELMGDDKIEAVSVLCLENTGKSKLDQVERENKFNKLFEVGDFFKKNVAEESTDFETSEGMTDDNTTTDASCSERTNTADKEPDYLERREPNSIYELKGKTYETDDNGQIYKKNKELLPNSEYTVNGNKYKTDEHGNKVSCDSNPEYTEEGSRNMKEQKESGGEERQEDDDGGHIIARILGGAEGEENLVPMRRTINRGDYKRMENEIAKALQEGKNVTLHIEIEYDGDSSRPSKIRAEYTIDDKKTVCEFDNTEGSTVLLDSLGDKISDVDYDRLKQTIEEMKEDGCDAAITSAKVEYDENGNPTKVTVGILDESTGIKKYKEYNPG